MGIVLSSSIHRGVSEMTDKWEISSAVADIFDPAENPLTQFIKTVDRVMNGNTVLLKGQADKPLGEAEKISFFLYFFLGNRFNDLFLEFDFKIQRWNYHEWHDTPESAIDFFAGWQPQLKQIVNFTGQLKPKPMSYLGFTERLYWMLRTSPNYYHVEHVNHETSIRTIQDVSMFLFGETTWTVGDKITQSRGLPNWTQHPWTFYDIVPDFLNTTGYWEHNDHAPVDAYFDGGASDSATFFFRDTTFYLLLTSGSP